MEIQEQLDLEIERRIQVMEQSAASRGQRFGKRDYLIWGAVLLFCLAAMICGAGA